MKKLSLNMKIVFVLSIFVAGSILISFLGLAKMNQINEMLNSMVDGSVARVNKAHEIKEEFFLQFSNEKNLILSTNPEERQSFIERLETRHEEMKTLVKTASDNSSEQGKADLKIYSDLYGQWWTLFDEVRTATRANNKELAAQLSMEKGRDLRLKIESILDQIIERNTESLNDDMSASDQIYAGARNMMIATSAIAILAGLMLAFFILRALGKTIDQVIDSLNSNSLQVTTAAGQIASSSEELSQAAAEQASSLEETAASIEEMSSMVQRNAENASRTSQLAQSSSQTAEKGKRVVQDMIRAIDDINLSNNTIMVQVEDSNKQISDIVNVIAEIGNKTKVINDIVFQTKLLSFNASVEAARAGEHGKGFAVVAEEVGSLAQMSGNAAKEISDMLEGSMKKVEGIVSDTKEKVGTIIVESKAKIENGTSIARECGDVLTEIVTNIANVNQMAGDISTASQEQAQGVQEITRAMGMLDQVTQTNAATSEEAASAAEELSAQSESLRASVNVLVQTIKGSSAETSAASNTSTRSNSRSPKVFEQHNVVQLKSAAKKAPEAHYPIKRVSGHDAVPSESDPRFEEI